MDAERRKQLKREGKALLERRSREVQEDLAATNPAEFASDEYVRNEIEIRQKERAIRRVASSVPRAEIERHFVLRIITDELSRGFLVSDNAFLLCQRCSEVLPSAPICPMACSCGNLVCTRDAAASDYAPWIILDKSSVDVVKLTARIEKTP